MSYHIVNVHISDIQASKQKFMGMLVNSLVLILWYGSLLLSANHYLDF